MINYKVLGFGSFEKYFNYFLNTLLPTNKTYYYFVDWKRVKENLNKYRHEIHLLNSLRGETKKTIQQEFITLVKKYPNVIKVLPILIAERVRNGKIELYDDILDEFVIFEFNKLNFNKQELEKIAIFCEKTGIFDLIINVKDLYDYLMGVEVGLDSNARKNRSGKIFEEMIRKMLITTLGKYCRIVFQDSNLSLYRTKNKKISKHDFVIYKNNVPIAVIEVNFYNTTGSKPDAIVGNYITMYREALKQGLKFIWITDGPAWKNMQEYLRKAMEEIEWVLNYKIAKENIKKIVLNK